MAMERVEVRLAVSSGLLAVFLACMLSVVPDEHDALVALTGELDPSTTPSTTATTTDTISGDDSTLNTSVPTDPFSVYKRCPWSPEKAGDFVIDFTRNGTMSVGEITIVANSASQMERWMTLPTHIPVGVYKVSLASYDDHSITTHWFEQNREQWFLELYDSSMKKLLVTVTTTDIGDSESLVRELVMSSAQLNGVVIKARAVHAAYPHTYSTQEVAPLCALFERVGDLPTTQEEVVVNTAGQTSELTTVSGTTATTTVPSEESVVQATEEVPVDTYLKCPIPARTGRTVVDFTRNGTVPVRLLTIVANASKVDAMKGPFPVNLSSGEYVVRLASYAEKPSASTRQVWYVTLFDETGKVLTKTPQSRDVPDGMGEYVSKVSDAFKIDRAVKALSAMHAEYASASSDSHAVLCAAFDFIEPIVEEKIGSDPQQEVETTTVPVPVTQNEIPKVTTVAPPPAPTLEKVTPNTVVSEPSTLAPPSTIHEEAPVLQRSEPVQTRSQTEEQALEQPVPMDPLFEALNEGVQSDRIETIVSLIREKDDEHVLEVRADGFVRTIVEGGVIDVDDEILRAAQEEGFQRRAKVEHLPDTDGDGVSDYDEMHLYGTDPANPQTAGGPLSDGTRLLLGLDPLGTTYEAVPVESPKAIDLEVNGSLRVYRVAFASSSSSSASSLPVPVRVEGSAAPLSFVTLYLFSTPIVVTVRADDVGKFTYEFEETLEDGSHEVYVTTVNRSGRIIAKSQPFTFVKTAEAIEYAAPVVSYDPVDDVARKMVIIVFVLLGVFGTAGLVIVGVWRSRRVDVVQV